MGDLHTSLGRRRRNPLHYARIIWLPGLLAALFVVQNHVFNVWLELTLFYLVRRTIITAGLGLLLFGPAVFMRRGPRHLYLVVVSLIVSLLFVIQFMYYSFAGTFLQASALRYANNLTAVRGTVATLLSPQLLFFVTPLAIVTISYLWLSRRDDPVITAKHREGWVALTLLVMLPVLAYTYVVVKEQREHGEIIRLYGKLYDAGDLVKKVGVINYSVEDLVKFALGPPQPSEADKAFVEAWAARHRAVSVGPDFGLVKGRNLILIQLESFEDWPVGRRLDGQEITPNLNRLTKEGLYFSHYFHQSGPGTTASAEQTVTNSLYPLGDDVAFETYPFDDYVALPGLLAKHGYATAALHGDVKSFWNRANVYPQLGYQKFWAKSDYQITRTVGWGLDDADFFSQSIPKLQSLPQPFMATLITLTSHSPFTVPLDLQTLRLTDRQGFSNLQLDYLQSVHYVDGSLGMFIQQLKSAGLYDNSLIAIYGDHKSYAFTQDDTALARFLGLDHFDQLSYLQNSQVPLVLLAPGTGLHGVNEQPASHLDLYPTLANLLGITPPKSVLGQDVLSTSQPVVTKRTNDRIRAIITNTVDYLSSTDGIFEHGQCLDAGARQTVRLDQCRALYQAQNDTLRVSDLAVKGNLIKILQ
jgi:lipoteichoic acid synthase